MGRHNIPPPPTKKKLKKQYAIHCFSIEDWHRILEGYSGGVDYPISFFYKDLRKAFPNAKVARRIFFLKPSSSINRFVLHSFSLYVSQCTRVDYHSPFFYKDLMKAFPNAKVARRFFFKEVKLLYKSFRPSFIQSVRQSLHQGGLSQPVFIQKPYEGDSQC